MRLALNSLSSWSARKNPTHTSGRARLLTKAQSELLIRRCVEVVKQLVEELSLMVSVTLVRSSENRADALTRVPREWLRDNFAAAAVAPAGDIPLRAAISDVRERADHPGVRRTLYFARSNIARDVREG